MFEFPVRPMNSVGIDRDLTDNEAHRRQLIADLKLAALKGIYNLVNELAKGRPIRACIEAKDNGWMLIAHVLVH